MDKQQLLEYTNQLLADIIMAKHCLNCGNELSQLIVSEKKIIHSDFFVLARSSFIYTGTIVLCKAYENDTHNKPFSIFQLLVWLQNTVKLTTKQKESLQRLEDEMEQLSPIIDKLRIQRDSFYAHNDKLLISDEKVEKISNVTYAQKMKLIQFAMRFLNYMRSVCEPQNSTQIVDIDLATKRLHCVLDDLERLYNIVAREREMLGGQADE